MSSISDRYALSSRFWLNFTSPGVEKDYVGEIASKNSFQIKLSSSLLILFSILLQVIFPKPLGFTLFIRVSIVVASILLLMTPKRYQEYAVVGVETCILVIGLVQSLCVSHTTRFSKLYTKADHISRSRNKIQ